MILISACLCGVNCKYNGENNINKEILELFSEGKAIPVCPEQLGGLPTPRPAMEIKGGTGADVLDGTARVIAADGTDATGNFIKGAFETLGIAQKANIKEAFLKAKSPSCGAGGIYDGSFSEKIIAGNGVTAELLIRNGIKVTEV